MRFFLESPLCIKDLRITKIFWAQYPLTRKDITGFHLPGPGLGLGLGPDYEAQRLRDWANQRLFN